LLTDYFRNCAVSSAIFMSERGAPMSAVAFRRMVTRLGPIAKMRPRDRRAAEKRG
jgi:hypothetical protein